MKIENLIYGTLATLISATLISGCATDSAVEEEFGSSVRHMISQQTQRTGDDAEGVEGEKSRLVYDNFRKDVAKPETVEKNVINLQFD